MCIEFVQQIRIMKGKQICVKVFSDVEGVQHTEPYRIKEVCCLLTKGCSLDNHTLFLLRSSHLLVNQELSYIV